MRLGMTATVAIQIEEEAAAMVVPLTALTEDDGSRWCSSSTPRTRRCARRPSIVGGHRRARHQDRRRPQAGDLVVTAGVQFLRDGMRVRLPGERAQAEPQAD